MPVFWSLTMQATNNGLVKFPLASTFNIAVSDTATIMGFADTSNPFIPEITSSYVFRKEFVIEFRAFLHQPDGDAYYVTGPTGSGKTSGITEVLGRLNWPVQQVTAHGRMELSDLVGHHALVSATPGAAPTMQFMHGPLALAMKHGHVLLINEIDMMDPSELSGLNDILEGRPLVIAQNAGEIIKPHPMFRVVATGNSAGQGDASGLYQGISMQNIASMDRYRVAVVDYDEAVDALILEAAFPKLPAILRNGMIKVAQHVRQLFKGENGQGGSISVTMSTRTLKRWATLTCMFKGHPTALKYGLEMALLRRAKPEEVTAIIRLASDVFGSEWA